MLGQHTPTPQYLPAAPGSGPEPLACIEWESIEVIIKTTSRSKCYIEFHSYCLEGEVFPWRRGLGVLGVPRGRASPGWNCDPCSPLAEVQRSGENTSQSCDIPGFLKLGWSAKHLPVVCAGAWSRRSPAQRWSIVLSPCPHPLSILLTP